jgi:energy-coupling factor transporter transmembrane protein EcfT
MKRMSQEEAAEAFDDFAQKAVNTVAPKISTAKRWLKRILAVFLILLSIPFFLSSAKVFGLVILVFGLYLAAGGFLSYKLEKIAGGLLFVVAGIAFACFGYTSYQKGLESKNWPVAKGSVTQSEIEKRTETTGSGTSRRKVVKSYPVVKYTYSVGNRDYQSGRITFGQSKDAHHTVARYPKGKNIQVYYNPENPAEAVLEPGGDATLSIVFIGLGAVLLVIGLVTASKFRKMSKALSQA